ncbi:MAG TPA: DUF1571 domain-containing protein [Pirellulales bacterium]|nr:DUF1571 domain-containing protein [Pirellulales bacterium]
MKWLIGGIICAAVVAAIAVFGFLCLRRDLGWSDKLPAIGGNSSGLQASAEAGHSHPLDAALDLAKQVLENIDHNVHDYTATVIMQSRFAGQLKPQEICNVKIRSQPFSIYMDFLAPESLKGQEAMYVEGVHDNQLVGHAGSGLRTLAGSVWLDPKSAIAMLGQRYPITELGIANLTKRLIEVGEHDRKYAECYVWRNDRAKVGDRSCILVTVMHPIRRPGFIFHIARIFIDKELTVPLHYEAYDWPAHEGDPPLLLERYTYVNLKLNPGLTDADFDPHNPDYHFGLK